MQAEMEEREIVNAARESSRGEFPVGISHTWDIAKKLSRWVVRQIISLPACLLPVCPPACLPVCQESTCSPDFAFHSVGRRVAVAPVLEALLAALLLSRGPQARGRRE